MIALGESQIARFYNGKSVLVTGFTGFIGKVLVLKLLQATDVNCVYVLLRPKRGLTASERLSKILGEPPFNFGNKPCSNLNKIKAIEGDIAVSGLDLTEKSLEEIISKVSLVFHIAANVRFENDMSCISDNVFGVRNILDLCHKINSLDCLIYVSTAYSNCNIRDVDEKVYPLATEAREILSLIESAKKEQHVHEIVTRFLGGRPNFYTFSKALGENFIAESRGNIRIAIARPSIIIQALKEPRPGWVDSLHGLPGIALACYIGLLRGVNWNYYQRVDVVPIDICSNALLAIGWYTATNGYSEHRVYNLTTGNLNPVTWGEMFELARQYSCATPSMKLIRPPMHPPRHRSAGPLFPIQCFINHILFALLFDLIMKIMGVKPTLTKITKKLTGAMSNFEYFTLNQWNFSTKNYEKVMEAMSESDRSKFSMDVREIKWNDYMSEFILGIRRFLLKESDDTLPRAMRRQKYINIGYRVFLTAIWFGLLAFTFSLYRLGHFLAVWQSVDGSKIEM